jgi:hypothetical protein
MEHIKFVEMYANSNLQFIEVKYVSMLVPSRSVYLGGIAIVAYSFITHTVTSPWQVLYCRH